MKKETKEKLIGARAEILASKELAAVVSVEAAMLKGARDYFDKNGFVEIVVPHMTKVSGACENVQTLFETDFFGKDAYLSQTGQLYLEAFIPRFEKVCCIGPSFRREDVVDERHLVEFPLIEIEHKGDLKILKKYIEGTIGSIVDSVQERCERELDLIGVNTKELDRLKPPFYSISYTDAINDLAKDFNLKWGDDLKSVHEARLVSLHDQKPVYVTHYPEHIKFFNMRLNRDESDVVNSGDLLMPYGGEAVGSAEREEDYGILEKRLLKSSMAGLFKDTLKRKGYDEGKLNGEIISRFKWYLDLVKKNPIQHAGCGIGMNRVTQAILQCDDIRAVTAYPLNLETIL